MAEEKWFAEHFHAHAEGLRAVAYGMLGSRAEAEDAVQEAWLRLDRADPRDVENLRGWLTTVVARVCLDMLRARKSRADTARDVSEQASAVADDRLDPEQELRLADSIGPALLVVLDTLDPAERVAFVLHDLFAVSFEAIAEILGRSPAASRQLASRARRRLHGTGSDADAAADRARERRIVDAFLAASRKGDFEALLAVLDPDVVIRADARAIRMGAPSEMRGAEAVAKFLSGRAGGARRALVNGAAGAVWIPGAKPAVVFDFVIDGERVIELRLIGERAAIDAMEIAVVDGA
jgi:RNA polymerase sigma-70 factor (ECF subfamily)